MASVTIQNVTKSFGETPVLREVGLEIRDGEFMTLLGPSGCGKSTLLRIVAGLELQSGGSVSIDGASVDHCMPKERDVAMVFQSYALYPYMTIAENMALPLVMRELTTAQRLPVIGRFMAGTRPAMERIDARVREVADSLAIGNLLQRKPAQLSGGQRQRAALGRAMVRDPKVFLMDEPLSNLDAKLRIHMRAELSDLHRRLQATFIYVTHDQSEAMTMSDRVALMSEGRILQVATPSALYNDPATLAVAEFVGSPKINVIPAVVGARGSLAVLGSNIPLSVAAAEGTAVHLGVRSENLSVSASASPGAFAGTVVHVENLGSDCFVHVKADGIETPIIARTEGYRVDEFRIGSVVHVKALPGSALVFDKSGDRIRTAADDSRISRHG